MNKREVRVGQKVKWRNIFVMHSPVKSKGKWSTKQRRVATINATVLGTRAGGRRVRIETEEPRICTVSPYTLSKRGAAT